MADDELIVNVGGRDTGLESLLLRMGSLLTQTDQVGMQFATSLAAGLGKIAGPAALAAGSIAAVGATVRSFGEAINFKAQLDATKASIDVQLNGVRDLGQVWTQAAKYASEYKLTQEQVTDAMVAAMPVIRASKADIGEILGVFQQLQLRDPAKTFQDAARALGELNAGQTQSIVRLFNVPLKDAAQMKKEIEGGADAVQVLNSYLTSTGASMAAVKTQTEGAIGKLKELKQAQEQLKLAQADDAKGPGMAILQTQIEQTRFATKSLQGDLAGMGKEMQDSSAFSQILFGALSALVPGITLSANTTALFARTTYDSTAAQQRHIQALTMGATTALSAGAAYQALHDKLAESLQATLADKQASDQLTQAQQYLANSGAQVASGLISAETAASNMAVKYGWAYDVAMKLVMAQAQLAGASIIGGKLFTAADDPLSERRSSAADSAANARAIASHQEWLDKLNAMDKKAGGVKLSDQQKLDNSLATDQQRADQQAEQAAQTHQQRLADIEEQGAEKRLAAEREANQAALDSRAGFYAQMGKITSAGIQKSSSEAYESAVNKSKEIAAAKGADVAEAYMRAQEQVISARAQRASEIEKLTQDAKHDKTKRGELEYLQGVDKLYRQAEDQKIATAAEGDNSLASQQSKALADENKQYQDQLTQLGEKVTNAADIRIAQSQRAGKQIDAEALAVGGLAAKYTTLGIAGARSGIPAPAGAGVAGVPDGTKAQVVTDPGVQNSLDTSNDRLSRLEGKLGEVVGAVQDVAGRVSGVESAIGGLRSAGGVS